MFTERRPSETQSVVGIVSGGYFLSHFYVLALPADLSVVGVVFRADEHAT
jgi:hypothetical protein